MIFLPTHKGLQLNLDDERISEMEKLEIVVPECFSLDNIVIEPEKFNESYYFDSGLEALRFKGFQRYARPIEIMTVLIDYLEKGEKSKYASLAKNMSSCFGEWVSVAFRKRGLFLDVALDPENLTWSYSSRVYYLNLRPIGNNVKSFDIGNKKSGTLIDLGDFPDDLVEYLYGRKFKDLPKKMQEGRKKAQLLFSEDWWPVGCGDFKNYYNFDTHLNYRVLRGVREK